MNAKNIFHAISVFGGITGAPEADFRCSICSLQDHGYYGVLGSPFVSEGVPLFERCARFIRILGFFGVDFDSHPDPKCTSSTKGNGNN